MSIFLISLSLSKKGSSAEMDSTVWTQLKTSEICTRNCVANLLGADSVDPNSKPISRTHVTPPSDASLLLEPHSTKLHALRLFLQTCSYRKKVQASLHSTRGLQLYHVQWNVGLWLIGLRGTICLQLRTHHQATHRRLDSDFQVRPHHPRYRPLT